MNEHILNFFAKLGSIFWLPIVIWLGYFFWCRYIAFPLDLEERIKSGKTWLYVPISWNSMRRLQITSVGTFIFIVGILLTMSTLYFLLPYGIISLGIYALLSTFFGLEIRKLGMSKMFSLQQDFYFHIYKQLAKQAHEKGDQISDSALHNQCMWQHQTELRQADKKGKLMLFLKGQAEL